jgi:hypothetical protein
MSIKNALALRNHTCQAEGHTFVLRRPSIADMAEAVVQAKQGDPGFSAWLVMNHLVEDGKPVFDTPEEVLACDGSLINFLVTEIDGLYDVDLTRQPSKS